MALEKGVFRHMPKVKGGEFPSWHFINMPRGLSDAHAFLFCLYLFVKALFSSSSLVFFVGRWQKKIVCFIPLRALFPRSRPKYLQAKTQLKGYGWIER